MDLHQKVYDLREKWGWMDDTQEIVDAIDELGSIISHTINPTWDQLDEYKEKTDAALVIFRYYRDGFKPSRETLEKYLDKLYTAIGQDKKTFNQAYEKWFIASKKLKTLQAEYKKTFDGSTTDENDLPDIRKGIAWLDENTEMDFMKPVQQQAEQVRRHLKGQETILLHMLKEWKRKLDTATKVEAQVKQEYENAEAVVEKKDKLIKEITQHIKDSKSQESQWQKRVDRASYVRGMVQSAIVDKVTREHDTINWKAERG